MSSSGSLKTSVIVVIGTTLAAAEASLGKAGDRSRFVVGGKVDEPLDGLKISWIRKKMGNVGRKCG